MPVRLTKRACIARSGIYQYMADEIPNLGGLEAGVPVAKRIYNVYRPATVLARTVDRFSNLPLTHHHAPGKVTPDNFRRYTVGWSGQDVRVEAIPGTDEVGIYSTVTIGDAEAFEAYERGEVQLSPEYNGIFEWAPGVTPSGQEYDIVLRDVIRDANHLALVPHGRGGSAASVLDHAGGRNMKVFSGLWRAIRKRLAGTQDEAGFKAKVEKLVADRAALTDEEIARTVDGLKADCATLPDSNGKEKLLRFIDDLRMVKDEAPEAAAMSAKIVADEYHVLDAAAMAEVPEPKTADDAPPPPPEKEEEKQVAQPGTEPPPAPGTPPEQKADEAPPVAGPAAAQEPTVAQLSPERAGYWMGMIADAMSKVVDGIRAELTGQPAAAPEPTAEKPAGDAPPPPPAEAQKGAEEKPPEKPATGDAAPVGLTASMSTEGSDQKETLDDHFKQTFKGGA